MHTLKEDDMCEEIISGCLGRLVIDCVLMKTTHWAWENQSLDILEDHILLYELNFIYVTYIWDFPVSNYTAKFQQEIFCDVKKMIIKF